MVNDKSELVEEEMTSSPNVYNTSSFLKDRSTLFIDDEAEECDSEIEVKDDFSDSEEEKMYRDARGEKDDFYDDEFSSEGELADEEELFSDDSEGFQRNLQRKRDQFVFDEVEVEGENLEDEETDDSRNETDNGSDLDSFINDDEPTVLDETIEEEEDFNSSMFYKTKKRKRVLIVDSDSEDNENKKIPESPKIKNLSNSRSNVLSNITFKSPNNSPTKQANSIKDKTITIHSEISPVSVPKTVLTQIISSDEDEDLDEIKHVVKKNKSIVILESDDESEPNVTEILSDLLSETENEGPDEITNEIIYEKTSTTEQTNTTGQTNTTEQTDTTEQTEEKITSVDQQEIENLNKSCDSNNFKISNDSKISKDSEISNDSKISSFEDDNLNEPKFSSDDSNDSRMSNFKKDHPNEPNFDSDSSIDSLNNPKFMQKLKNAKRFKSKIIESDSSDDEISFNSKSSNIKDMMENDSVECVFTDEEKDDLELNESDLEDNLEDTLT